LLGASLSNKSAIALFRGNLEICCTVIAAETDIEAHRHDLTQINTRPFSEVNNILYSADMQLTDKQLVKA
jgi:hypothetical protein